MADAASLIREATLPERTWPACLRPDLIRAYESLQEQKIELESAVPADSMVGASDTTDVDAQLAELTEEMRASTITFVLRALPRPKFRALWSAHPPRQGADGNPIKEDLIGVNQGTFFRALIRQSTVSPELDEETWNLLLDEKLSDRQWHDFANACFDLSQERLELPFKS